MSSQAFAAIREMHMENARKAEAERATPKRVQLRRTKGWKMPENTVRVARPGKWGNPYTVADEGDAERAVARYRNRMAIQAVDLRPLRGKNLACWCPLDGPCHADVLLMLANAASSVDGVENGT